jgi:imidazolonepropionase-like amidohydrolase/ABC-type molybdate transport system substrate-binding protein
LFEGARLIIGDESAPIENSAFLVEGSRFTRVGRKGELTAPEGASRVDLTGKTVMPAIINAHGHLGYRRGASFAVENYTRENIIDHLERLAYHGVAAVMSMGAERPDLGYALRDELRTAPPPDTALFLTAGQGLAMPNGGPAPPLRDAPYGVSTGEEARKAVQELARRQIDHYVKIWVDDRGGTVRKLPNDVYTAAIDEAHRNGLLTVTHTFELEDVKAILRAGVDGLAHPPWRSGKEVDDELVGILKERPVFVLLTLWSTRNDIFGRRPFWIDDPLLPETFTREEIAALENTAIEENAEAQWKAGIVPRGVAKLKAAGVKFALGDDSGATNGAQYFGFASHIEMAAMVEAGLTPAEVITAATRNAAEILKLDTMGTVAQGKSADFIVLDADPLENIHNTRRINSVYLRGAKVNRDALRAKWTGMRAAAAAPIKVLSGNGARVAVAELASQFERETGRPVSVEFQVNPQAQRRIETGEACDVAILNPPVLDDLTAKRRIAAGTRVVIGRSGIGVGAREGAPPPDISTVEAFKRTLLNANAVAYPGEGASGRYFVEVVDRLGLTAAMKPKMRPMPAEYNVEVVATGEADLVVVVASRITGVRGVQLVGRIPQELQTWIGFTGGVCSTAEQPEAARELLRFFTSTAAAPVLERAGIEPFVE